MTRKKHSCLNVRGFLRYTEFPRGYVGVFTDDNGGFMLPDEAREVLFDEVEKGHRVIPMSHECGNPCKHEGCVGFKFGENGCPGYEIPD